MTEAGVRPPQIAPDRALGGAYDAAHRASTPRAGRERFSPQVILVQAPVRDTAVLRRVVLRHGVFHRRPLASRSGSQFCPGARPNLTTPPLFQRRLAFVIVARERTTR